MPEITLLHLGNRPQEAELIGRMILAYGELEYIFNVAFGALINDDETAFRLMYRLRSEHQKLEAADAIMRPHARELRLSPVYGDAFAAIGICRQIRNQYAHSLWDDDDTQGLRFIDAETPAKKRDGVIAFSTKRIDLALLKKQAEYFGYASDLLWHLANEAKRLRGQIESHNWERPRPIPPVKLHNQPPQQSSRRPEIDVKPPKQRRTPKPRRKPRK